MRLKLKNERKKLTKTLNQKSKVTEKDKSLANYSAPANKGGKARRSKKKTTKSKKKRTTRSKKRKAASKKKKSKSRKRSKKRGGENVIAKGWEDLIHDLNK